MIMGQGSSEEEKKKTKPSGQTTAADGRTKCPLDAHKVPALDAMMRSPCLATKGEHARKRGSSVLERIAAEEASAAAAECETETASEEPRETTMAVPMA